MAEKHILVVEDDMISAKLTKHRLEKAGYTVRVAGDAYTGTQEALKGHYDLIILDLLMPAGGGFSILERIRSVPQIADVPVVILTGKELDDEMKQEAERLEANSIFFKPPDYDRLVEKLKSIVPVGD